MPQIEEPTTSNEDDDDDEALLRDDYLLGKSLYEQRKTKSCNDENIIIATATEEESEGNNNIDLPCYRESKNNDKEEECFCPICRVLYDFYDKVKVIEGEEDGGGGTPSTPSTTSSKQTLCRMILPSDCESRSKLAFGGAVMKEMDNAAGCAAYRHCCTTKNNVVTVSITDLDFTGFVKLGDVVTVNAELVFCSNKSMDVLVTASTYNSDNTFIDDGDDDDNIVVAKGIFTFVSLDHQTYRPLPVPMLRYESESELRRAYERQVRYETSKRQRRRK